MNNIAFKHRNNNEEGINLINFFYYLSSKWLYFLISVLFFLALSLFYYYSSSYTYFYTVNVLIKNPANKTYSANLRLYDRYINNVILEDEKYLFKSKWMMQRAVKKTNTDVSYKIKQGLRNVELYKESPVLVNFINVPDNDYFSFTITPINKESLIVNFKPDKNGLKYITINYNDTILMDKGGFIVASTKNMDSSYFNVPIKVTKYPVADVAKYYCSRMGVLYEEEGASVLSISIKDISYNRAKDLLYALVDVYNQSSIEYKKQSSLNMSNYIEGKLANIEAELNGIEFNLERFKIENNIWPLSTVMTESYDKQDFNNKIVELETQLGILNYMKDYLEDEDIDLIPVGIGVSGMNIDALIAEYNNYKMRVNTLIEAGGIKNPVVEDIKKTLFSMKNNMLSIIDNMIQAVNTKLNDLKSFENNAQNEILTLPTKEKEIRDILRQQKIKEDLYLYLLNKREENALSEAMADTNAQIIDNTIDRKYPIAPQKSKVLFLGLLLGISFPLFFFIILLFTDNKIRCKADIENLTRIPLLGEIPLYKKYKHSIFQNNELAEVFSILRTNVMLINKNNVKNKVVTFTSFNESAGKTFIAKNLAVSFLHAGKKVLVVDLDIRKGTMSKEFKVGSLGVTNYLSDSSVLINDIIYKSDTPDKPDLIAAGPIAPNPSELLMSSRVDELFIELRKMYDYIIVDNVPYGIVADADIANRVTDVTIFVIRSNRLNKNLLQEINELYEGERLKNMSIVLNAIRYKKREYNSYKG